MTLLEWMQSRHGGRALFPHSPFACSCLTDDTVALAARLRFIGPYLLVNGLLRRSGFSYEWRKLDGEKDTHKLKSVRI